VEPIRAKDPEVIRRQKAASELARRKRAVQSLHTFGMSIDIPGVMGEAPQPDETLCPAEYLYALHHRKIIAAIERTINRPFGRLLIQAPPGSAKSTYASVVLPPYVMGRREKFKFILTSYASELAWKQSKRAMQIIEQEKYKQLAWPFDQPLDFRTQAAANWELNNGSECVAAGLRAGITGNRADGWVIDDPVAGQLEADSQSDRKSVWDAYKGDLLTRVKPEAWGILIMTRWHEDDLAGRILPEEYKGESGIIIGRDGLEWEVLNIPAKAEHVDDPLGRPFGEYLWPEYFPPKHWHIFEHATGQDAQRVWSSLYQQRPTPQGAGMFTKESFNWYDKGELPPRLAFTGAGDYAVTKGKNDFTEIGIVGLDNASNMWFVDWWYKQESSDVWTEETLDMALRWGVYQFYNEGGVIDKATRPGFNKRMRERQEEVNQGKRTGRQFININSLPSMQDKVAKLQAFQARANAGTVWLPRWQPWAHRLVELLCAFPAGRHDDGPDVCGLLGRAIDQMPIGAPAPPEQPQGLKPFTVAWLEYEEKPDETPQYV
jgi:predicted phage terminase large subunit-like protein